MIIEALWWQEFQITHKNSEGGTNRAVKNEELCEAGSNKEGQVNQITTRMDIGKGGGGKGWEEGRRINS